MEARCEPAHLKVCAQTWAVVLCLLFWICPSNSGTVNSPGKFGFCSHWTVCVVCSVSIWDSVLAGCAPALGLALKGRKICPPRACSSGQTSELPWGTEPNEEGEQGQPDKEVKCLRNQLEASQRSRTWVQSQITELMGRKKTVLSSQQCRRLSKTKPKRKDLSSSHE